MLLSGHMYCVAVIFEMTERVEQQICIKLCVKFDIPQQKLFGWFRRPQLWTTGDWQLHHNNAPAHTLRLVQFFLWNIKSPRWFSLLQPRCDALWLLAFPKTKITFEREEISDHWWDSGKYSGAADSDWKNCVRSQGAYLEGDWGITVLCTSLLYLVSPSINVSIFHSW